MNEQPLDLQQLLGDDLIDRTLERRQRRFESDVENLQAAITKSLKSEDPKTFERGTRILRDLVAVTANYASTARDDPIHPLSNGGPSVYGQEWQILLECLSATVDAAGFADEHSLRVAVIDMVFESMDLTFQRNQYPAARNVAAALAKAFSAIVESRGNWTGLEGEYLLMRMTEYGAVATRLPDVPPGGALVICQPFATMVRGALEADNPRNSALHVVEAFLRTGRHADRPDFELDRDATALALLGWALRHEGLNPERGGAKPVAAKLVEHFRSSRRFWSVLLRALDNDFEHALGWVWWEMEGGRLGEPRGGAVELGEYIKLGAILVGAQRGRLVPPTDPSDRDADMAMSLTTMIDEILGGRRNITEPRPRDSNLRVLRDGLAPAISARESRRTQQLIDSPLDQERVREFIKAVATELPKLTNVSSLLDTVILNEPARPSFGFYSAQAKWWFVDSHVHADPDDLAQSLTRELVRAEEERILEVLESLPAMDVQSVDQLLDEVGGIFEGTELPAPIILTNSWSVTEAMLGSALANADRDHPLTVTLGSQQVPFYRAIDNRDPYLLLISRNKTLVIERGAPIAEGGDVILGNRFAVAARLPNAEEVDQLSRGASDQAELDRHVIVRLLEVFAVHLPSGAFGFRWALPESLS